MEANVTDMTANVQVVLLSFDVFYDREVIYYFFVGKLPFVNWIKQSLNTIVSQNGVEKIYAGS